MNFIIFISIFHFSQALFAIDARVLIDDKSLSKEIQGEFSFRCLKVAKEKLCPQVEKKFPLSRWRVELTNNLLRIKNLKNKNTFSFKGESFEFRGDFLLDDKKVSHLKLYNDQNKINWVLQLPLEQYLYGVISAEVPISWPMETLKAQAIASRTYFLFKKMQRVNEVFDVRSDILDQVFSFDQGKHFSIISAVESTKGQILVTQDEKQIFPAYFHSDCGGHTSSEKKVWRKLASYNEVVKDPYCHSASKNNWFYSINKKQLQTLLQSSLYLPKDIELKKIMPRLSDESRSHVVDLLFSGNILKRVSANDLRKLLGFAKLKSTQFEVSHYWNSIEFSGRGFGHGVGLCQWGAQRWARKGKTSEFILKHYYPNSKIKMLSDSNIETFQANSTN